MSKNIEDIVSNTFKQVFINPHCCHGYLAAQVDFRQALTEGKLVVPLSKKEIYKIIDDNFLGSPHVFKECAKAIYEAQFGGNK